jgi:hypothetical protein
MLSQYVTRNGLLASINGISEYRIYNEDHIMLSGTVDGQDCEWDKQGRYRLNRVLGIKEPHSLDLVGWIEDEVNDGKYYFEAKGKV